MADSEVDSHVTPLMSPILEEDEETTEALKALQQLEDFQLSPPPRPSNLDDSDVPLAELQIISDDYIEFECRSAMVPI